MADQVRVRRLTDAEGQRLQRIVQRGTGINSTDEAFIVATVTTRDVLGNPVRRRILELLAPAGRGPPAGSARSYGPSSASRQPAVSQHLRVLRETGFLRVRPVGTARLYAADPDRLCGADD